MFEESGVDSPLKAVVDAKRCCDVTGVSNIVGIRSQDDRLQLTTLNEQATRMLA